MAVEYFSSLKLYEKNFEGEESMIYLADLWAIVCVCARVCVLLTILF